MTFLPIVDRELRVAAREPKLYKARAGAAFIAIVFEVWAMFSYSTLRRVGLGTPHALFAQFAFYLFLFCLISGPQQSSDCVSSEKREGTLGLLFLTDLTGLDIVLGKLLATSVASFYRLLAVFPVVAVLLTMGGVSAGEFFRLSLVLLNTLLLTHAIAIFASTLGKDARHTKGNAICLVLLFWLVLPATEFLLNSKLHKPWLQTVLLLPSPYHAIQMTSEALYPMHSREFWFSLLANHAVAWGFLLWAARLLPRVWQDKGVTVRRMKWRERWAQFCYGKPEKRLAWRRRLMDKNAFLWLVSRNRLRPYWIWFLLSCVMAIFCFIFLLLFAKPSNFDAAPAIAIWGAICLNSMIKLWILGEASHHLATSRRDGSLEWLLSTPLSVAEIIRGQWLALRRLLGGPAVAVCIADFLMLVLGVMGTLRTQSWDEDTTGFVLVMLAGMGMLGADAVALAWAAMWNGLNAPQLRQAAGDAFARVLLLPWILFGLASGLTATAIEFGKFKDPGWFYWVGLWFVIGIANDIGWGLWSRYQLHLNFRLLCAPPEGRRRRRWWEFWKPKPLDNPRWVAPK